MVDSSLDDFADWAPAEDRPKRTSHRQKALERDRHMCQCCYEDSADSRLEVHHIQPLCLGGQDDLDNLITLCSWCHKESPNSAAEFEDYRQKGGVRGRAILLQLFDKCDVSETKQDVLDWYDNIMGGRLARANEAYEEMARLKELKRKNKRSRT
ncbi:MAG: HNH endonuclease [Tildeniella nuda ZEHNDER 1965/U140]|jgi:hypothetical protein|nr:HNH endonuclease [Tildeniella nuda ZEHNDER 1965/U140]